LKFKFKIERDIKQLKDLEGLTEQQCLEVFLKMGVQFDRPPMETELGNLRYPDNIHVSSYIDEGPCIHRKTEKGFEFVAIGSFDPEWQINESLIVKSMNALESLKRYAKMIKDECADMTDEQLLSYSCLGEKRFARARDECLRRKLISKVGE